MRYFPTLFAVLALGFATVAFSQTNPAPTSAIPPLKTLPANIKAELETALGKVDKNNGKALAKVTVKIAKKYSSFVPEIAADAVAFLADALKNDPATAKNVIPQIIAALTKANPSLTGPIVAAALGALPPSMKEALTGPLVRAVIAAVPEKREKAAALNAALLAVGTNPGLLAELDRIALENKISITQTGDNETNSQRYYVLEDESNAQWSGDQGVNTTGATANTGSGGGNASGTQPAQPTPTPNPTATPTPTPKPTPVSM